MTGRVWVRGANGLWRSYDKAIRRQSLRQRGKDRIAAIGDRFLAVMTRNGWEKKPGKRKWTRIPKAA